MLTDIKRGCLEFFLFINQIELSITKTGIFIPKFMMSFELIAFFLCCTFKCMSFVGKPLLLKNSNRKVKNCWKHFFFNFISKKLLFTLFIIQKTWI